MLQSNSFIQTGERFDLKNYRPISVTPIIAKVLERIVYNQLYRYLTMNNLISSQQSGFRSLHSTVTALLHATDNWAFNIDKGNINTVVFLDLKKAFDTVDHDILLSKLEPYGIKDSTYNFFKSYLNIRTQKCVVNGSISESKSLAFGIPQGTILGPLLFILYINDLPNCLENSEPQMYTNDTHLKFAGNNVDIIEQKLNQDLISVSNWLVANKLTLNKSKTEFMVIGSRPRLGTFDRSPALKIENVLIKQVGSTKSLGVHVDGHLTWNTHISHISRKIASGIGAIKRCRPFAPTEALVCAYNAIVQPHFDYCDIVWGNCGETNATKLQKLKNRAARVLTYSSHVYHMATVVYKSLNRLVPEYLQLKFVYRNSQYSPRDSINRLALPLPRTNYLKNSFRYSGAVLWNSLATGLRQAESLNSFKSGRKEFFFK